MAPARKSDSNISTRDLVFAAAKPLFSARGYDGVSVDDIARAAGVNKAMIYYHFADKIALYRAVVGDGLKAMGEAVQAIVLTPGNAPDKLDAFVEAFVAMTQTRPWMPSIMLREIAEGAPHLDAGTLEHMSAIVLGFAAIVKHGQEAGVFRDVNPVLAYASVVGPIILNAARERVALQPDKAGLELPLLVSIPHSEVIEHCQRSARRMLMRKKYL